jgi:membrane-associated phospholipid phosphatase
MGTAKTAKASRAVKRLHDTDRRVSEEASRAKDTLPLRIAATIGELADQPPLIALSAATLAIGLLARHPRAAAAGARMLASHLLATAIKTAVKRSVDRTRPHSVEDGRDYRLEPGDSGSHHYSSFPSGHTAGAMAVTRAAARVWPDATPALAAVTVGVGALQLPIGKHYASDVAAGAVIGLASEAVVNALADRVERALGVTAPALASAPAGSADPP